MTFQLKPEQQRVIDLAVQSGAYQSPGEVLDQAFEIIREQLGMEDWMLEQREEVAAHIAKGFAQAERGELMDGDAALESLRQRRAERLKSQGNGVVPTHAARSRGPGWHLVEHCERQPGGGGTGRVGIVEACHRLAKHPRMGNKRLDITTMPVRFWTVAKFPNYVIVYRPNKIPLQVLAILHARRDLKEALRPRF